MWGAFLSSLWAVDVNRTNITKIYAEYMKGNKNVIILLCLLYNNRV